MLVEQRPHLLPGEEGRIWRRSERRIRAPGPRRHRELAAYHVISGQMRYLLDDQVIILGPQSLLWAFTDQAHMLLSETPDFDMWVLVFSDALLAAVSPSPPRLRTDPAYRGNLFQLERAVHDRLASIAHGIATNPDPDYRAAGMRWWALDAWSATQVRSAPVRPDCHPAVRQAAIRISEAPGTSLAALASEAAISTQRLGRLFKAQTGESLTIYRARCRLAEVDRLVANSARGNLTQHALDAGFGSYAHFYRCFVKLRATNPRRYYAM